MDNNWFKIWPSNFIGVINRIPDQSLRGDVLLIAFHMLNEMGLKDDDTEIAWVTGLAVERVQTLRPYLDRLKDKGREDGRLMFDFVLDTIVERQEFADKKAKAGQSGGRTPKTEVSKPKPPKAVLSSAKHGEAQQSSVEQCDTDDCKTKQTKAIHTDIHVDLDKSRSIADGDPPPVSGRKKPPDPRKDHIAITTCRSVANSFPPKELWDDLILLLGDNPDRAKLESCRKEWLERGYNRISWKWATEWYPNGTHTNGNRASPEGRETLTHYADGREKPEGMKGFVC
jgi:hypothetical protein